MRGRGVAVGVAVASSASTRSDLARGGSGSNSQGNLLPLSFDKARSGGYVGAARLAWLRERLSERDWVVTRDVARLRLVTGAQLERLHFTELSAASGPVVRRRVLGRLVRWGVLATLARRIGGERAGSVGLVYTLEIAGKRLVAGDMRATRPGLPGVRYVRHVLAVAEVYVALVERTRLVGMRVDRFDAEPASWWSDGHGGRLKPDAFVRVASEEHTDSWWVEVDLATEHLPTIRRKLMTYLDFYNRGQLGPDEIMPWVLITVPDAKRYSDIVRLIRQLARRAENLFTVALHDDATEVIMRRLNEPLLAHYVKA
jgi:Replication-relaxation